MTDTKLNDIQLENAKWLLQDLVVEEKNILSALDRTRSLSRAIESVGPAAGNSPSSEKRIALISKLDRASDGDIELSTLFLEQKNVLSFSDAARQYSILLSHTGESVERFKIRIFAEEPTATLYSLVSSEHITVIPADMKLAVIKLLDAAVSNNFKINEHSIESFLEAEGQEARDDVKNFLRSLQRLQALVRVPEDIDALLQSSFTSAHQIAHTPRNSFVKVLNQHDIDGQRAIFIHEHATLVDMRNEQAWAALLASKSHVQLAALPGSDKEPSNLFMALSATPIKQVTSYTEIFGDAFIGSCDDCNSVTSPAAYFVDLLRMLKNTPSDASQTTSPSLLDKILVRRPDLLTLQLSCVNTNVLIPYIDLANEAMESFIKNVGTLVPPAPVPIHGFNMTDQDTSDISLAEPNNTDYSVYRDEVSNQYFPLTVFPYSQALDFQRLFFSNLNTSFSAVIEIFGSESRLLPHIDSNVAPDLAKLAKSVVDTANAAEFLGLSPADYVAITGSSVFSFDFFKAVYDHDLQQDAYDRKIGRLGTGQYWGYQAADGKTAEQVMLSEDNNQGLPFVRAQLLRRANLTFEQLIDLLKARLLQGQLVLENPDNTAIFSGKMDDLRLRHPTKEVPNAPLTEQDCWLLQSYIRLWRKTGWTLQDLDCAVVSFGTGDVISGLSITAETITSMAAVYSISTLTGIEIYQLMPFWSIIDTNGDRSLYARLFLRGKAGRKDPVYGADDQGRYLQAGASLQNNRAPLLSRLGLTEETFAAIITAAIITNDKLDLANVTTIYRITMFCKTLGINPIYFQSFQTLLDPDGCAFATPKATLNIIRQFQESTDAGLSLEQMLFFTNHDNVLLAKNVNSGLSVQQIAIAIFDIVTSLQSSYAVLPVVDGDTTVASPADVSAVSTKIFDLTTAQQVIAFLEMLPGTELTDDSKVYMDVLRPFFGDTQAAHKVFFEQPEPTGTEEEKSIANEKNLNSRRVFFLKAVIGPLQGRIASDTVLQVLAPLYMESDSIVLSHLLGTVNGQSQDEQPVPKAIEKILGDITGSNEAALKKGSSDVFFVPLNVDLYRFFVPDTSLEKVPSVTLDTTALVFSKDVGGWISDQIRLSNGQAYNLRRSNGGLTECSYSTPRSPRQPFPSETLLARDTVTYSQSSLRSLSQAAGLCTSFKVNVDELQFFQSQEVNTNLAIDLGNIDCKTVQLVQRYRTLSQRTNGTIGLLSFLKWTCVSPRDGTLVAQLIKLTNVSETQIQDYATQRFSNLTEDQLVRRFQGTAELEHFLDSVAFVDRTGVPGLTFQLLCTLATPVLPPTSVTDFDNAAKLRPLLRSVPASPNGSDFETKVNNGLRVNQRTALVNYLLQHPYISAKGIIDADGLFEFLLIDVQMGACLKTSRIKQAISTVQLYIRRCILGLEKSDQVASNTINMDRWKWMQGYRLWEANRKVFLYPENWLDASLRDDKTEVFKALESSILQNDLDSDKVVDLIKSYVYGVDGIADLDVQAYLWKKVEDWTGTFHFFARTRTAPYIYYYRPLEIIPTPSGRSIKIYWQPWTKIDVEVPVHEVDADGKPLQESGSYLIPALYGDRIFIFFPQIALKTEPNAAATDKPIKDVGNEKTGSMKAVKYWQVQMGWTEYRNGRWTPKQVSQASLDIRGAQDVDFPMQQPDSTAPGNAWNEAVKLPDISSFKFWIRSRKSGSIPSSTSGASAALAPSNAPLPSTSILVIDVERWVDAGQNQKPRYVNYPLGRFEMRGSQVILVNLGTAADPSDPFKKPWRSTIPTKFAKMWWHMEQEKDPAIPGIPIGRGTGADKEPLLGVVTKLMDNIPKKDVHWTLSFNDSQVKNATGFVQDVVTTESTISYVTYPPIASSSTFASDVFQHTLDRDLVSMSTMYNGLDQVYAFLGSVPQDDTYLAFGKRNGPVHELSTPYALYNWELGAHSIMLLMERLQVTQQYDLALQVSHFVFDPTIDGTSLTRCWVFPPFKELAAGKIDSVEDILKLLQPSSGSEEEMKTSILEWRKNPFNTHVVARGRPLAYMRRIIMKYIEILIASGDVYFRQNTLEALPLAIQRYVEASHVFGSAPVRGPKLAKPVYKSYADLDQDFNDFSNAAFDLELDFPFFSDPASRGGGTGASGTFGLTGILKTTYFCVPSNPKLVELRDLIDDRLFKIRNCQDIYGVARSLALFEPPLDPGMLVRATAGGVDISQLVSSVAGPMPNYRFQYLLQKAQEMCAEVKSMGTLMLSIKERKDAEALANLRSRQDRVVQNLMIEMKKTAKKEAESSIDALLETRRAQVIRLEYYLALTGSDDKSAPNEGEDWEDIAQSIEKPTTDDLRMTSHEKLEMEKADAASDLNQKATILDIAASIIKIIPDINEAAEPLGVGVSIDSITKNICESMMITSNVMRAQAQHFGDEGARASRTGGLIKQLQERRLQANMAGRDIKETDKQILTARIRVEMCERDMQLQQQQAEYARDTEEWLRTKYSSEQLYTWMDGIVRNLHHQTYLIADDLAQKAQKVFQFEKGDQSVNIISPYCWDAGRDGLFSGENLFLSLKRLEGAYMEKRLHDFEIVKNISLRQIRPWALLNLRETGAADFDLPEVLFDFDFPGHYCRRIKSVGMTIPCIVGPYTSVNATLTLLEHRYRVKSDAKSAQDYPQKAPDDRFQTDQVPIASIAVSHGQQDSGVFNLDFKDERYIPFEGAGAVSRWRLELPTTIKQFDYNTISDIVLHMKYTAIQGGAAFRKVAAESAAAFQKTAAGLSLNEGMFAVLDLPNEFPSEWYRLVTADKTKPSTMPLLSLQDRLPFFTKGKTIKAESISVLSESSGINLEQDITMTASSTLKLKAGTAIGSYQVAATSPDMKEPVIDWSLTLSPKAMNANVSRVLILFRYILL
ncbi:toxin subunit [Fusarium heterosporum]|uniref:Toxin subunit n=1 Tax=Fusarium heterosporum TaxID=42747 RepID=A0A8H5U1J5_FUSHE|nr:toxin subunit [Fusarium heterosporum]